VKDWDDILLQQLQLCASAKAILTTYPLGYELPSKLSAETRISFLVAKSFGDDGFLRYNGKLLRHAPNKPIPTFFWASGFSFSSAKIISEVPYDPHLSYLFFGEESSMTVRLWTNGWDFFVPTVNIVYHLWSRSYRPTFREIPNQKEMEQRAQQRVRHLLCMQDTPAAELLLLELNKYALGSFRSLSEYCTMTGVDFRGRQLSSRALCGGLSQTAFFETAVQDVMRLLNVQQQNENKKTPTDKRNCSLKLPFKM